VIVYTSAMVKVLHLLLARALSRTQAWRRR